MKYLRGVLILLMFLGGGPQALASVSSIPSSDQVMLVHVDAEQDADHHRTQDQDVETCEHGCSHCGLCIAAVNGGSEIRVTVFHATPSFVLAPWVDHPPSLDTPPPQILT